MAAVAVGRVLRLEPPTHNNRILYILCKSLDTYLLAFTYIHVYICIYRPTRERDELNAPVPGDSMRDFSSPTAGIIHRCSVYNKCARVCVRVHSVRNSSALRIIIIYICVQRRLGLDHVNKMVCTDRHHHRRHGHQLLTEHITDRKICFVPYYNTIYIIIYT